MSKRQHYYRNRQNRPFLNLERLEDRTVPAYTATLSGSVATFIGNSSGASGDIVVFGVQGGFLMHNRGLIDAGFNSELDFDSSVAGDQTLAASATSIINLTTGSGPDQIRIGGQVDSGLPLTAASSLLAEFNLTKSGAGAAKVIIDDSLSATGNTFNYANSGITATGIDVSFTGAFSGGIDIFAGSGNDSIIMANGASLNGGTLSGNGGTDTIDYSAYTTAVSVNLTTSTATGMAAIAGVENVTGSSAGDNLVGSSVVNTLRGLGGNDVITGGPGNDVFFGGTGNDEFIWNPGDGSDIVEGDADADILTFNGSNGNEIFQLSANGSRGLFQRNLGNIFMDTNQVETLVVNGIGGTDDFNINNTTGVADLTLVDLNGGTANDNFDVIPSPTARIDINGGTGTNTLTINLAGTTNPIHTPTSSTSGNTTYGNREDVDYQDIQNFSGINGSFGSPPPSFDAVALGTISPLEINKLFLFNRATPGTLTTVSLTGLFGAVNRIMAGIDFRPSDGNLYGIAQVDGTGNQLELYRINPVTGETTLIGGATLTGLTLATAFDMSFNPVTDEIRVVTNLVSDGAGGNTNNFRINPNTGALINIDTDLNFSSMGSSSAPVVGIAYNNHHAGASSTTLFGITSGSDTLVIHGGTTPSVADISLVGSLGVNTSNLSGLDIDGASGEAFALLTISVTGSSSAVLHRIDLATGQSTLIGAMGGNIAFADLAVVPAANTGIPVVTPPTNQGTDEGFLGTFLLGSFTDANNSGNYTVTINWGDGTADTIFNQTTAGNITLQDHAFAQDGVFTVTITVADADGTSAPATFTHFVGNVTPGITPPANQGASSGVSQAFNLGSFTDPGADAPWNISINWGDGSSNTNFSVNTPGAIPVQNHTYANPGNFTVTITVNDDDSSSNSSFQVSVANVVPVVTPPANQSASEGTNTSFNLGSFADSNNSGNYTVTVNWGDGTPNTVFNQATTGAITLQNHIFAQDGNFTVSITVADVDGTSTAATFAANVGNVLPVRTPPVTQSALAGISQLFDLGSFVDPGSDAPWGIVVNWGDGSPNTTFQVNTPGAIPNQSHTYATSGTFTMIVNVSDDDGTQATTSDVNVANPVPVVTPPVPQNTNEGASTTFLLGAFTDVNNSGNYTVTVNWGDGTPNTVFNQAATGTITAQNHTYSQDGNFPVTVIVSDVNGSSTPIGFQANIINVLPVAVNAPDQNGVATIAKSFALGSFIDPGADAPWHITVNWGDGSPNGSFNVSTPGELPPLTHAFANAGQFNVVVTVQDDDGTATSDYLVNVIPPIAHLTGNVFRDFNNNGLLNSPDVGFAGVTVFADRDGDGELDANEPFTATDANGDYQLDVGFEGAVSVRQVIPDGFKQTTANPADVNVQFGDTVSVDSLGDNRIITPTIAVAGRLKALPFVQVRDADGTLRFSFSPFTKPSSLKEVRLATGDVNDDGIEDVFVVPGPGASSLVKVFDGANGLLLSSFTAFAPTFSGGVSIAAGDVNGDGVADIVVGTDKGAGPLVKIFNGSNNQLIRSFVPTNANLYTGVKVALGDVDGDGVVDVITSPGTSTESVQYRIRAQDALTGASLLNFLVKPVNTSVATLNITAGDLDHDGRAEIILATSRNGQTQVQTFKNGVVKEVGLPFAVNFRSTAFSVATKDLTGDGVADLLFAGSQGLSPRLKLVNGATGETLFSALLLGDKDRNGLIVG